jgi:Amidohydrolase
MPFVLERLDNAWEHARAYGGVRDRVPSPPSSYVDGRVYGCIFDDQAGLAMRATIGMGQIMIETDYPHGDSTWPHSRETAEKIVATAGLDDGEAHALVRGNAIRCYGLDHYFGIQH